MSLAKGLASERARQVLGDKDSPYHLSNICDCAAVEEAVEEASPVEALDGMEPKKLDDETEEGFAALAQIALTEVQGGREADVVVEPEEEEVVEERPDENKSLSDHILNGKDIVGGDSIHSDMMDLDEV